MLKNGQYFMSSHTKSDIIAITIRVSFMPCLNI